MGTVDVGSPTALYVAMGGWAVGAVVAEFSASCGCQGSKTLVPIGANQGKDGGCMHLCWIGWLGRYGISRWLSGKGRWSTWCCLLRMCWGLSGGSSVRAWG